MKKIVSLILIFSMIFVPYSYSYCEEYTGYHKIHEKTFGVDVYVKDGLEIDAESLESVLFWVKEENRKAVTIHSIENLKSENGRTVLENHGRYYYTKTFRENKMLTNVQFIISQAKGSEGSLSEDKVIEAYSKVLSSREDRYSKFAQNNVNSNFGELFKYRIDKNEIYKGVPESLEYNSRSYYAGVVNEQGTYKVWRWRNNKKVFNFRVPKEIVIFSVDDTIK